MPLATAYRSFEREPIAAASLGQVRCCGLAPMLCLLKRATFPCAHTLLQECDLLLLALKVTDHDGSMGNTLRSLRGYASRCRSIDQVLHTMWLCLGLAIKAAA